jgi:hypothetical protein
MKRILPNLPFVLSFALIGATLTTQSALAEIVDQLPQPDIVLYGQIVRGNDLVREGELVWTYTPLDGGTAIVRTAQVTTFPGPGGVEYSYRISLPVGFPLFGQSTTADSIPLSDQSLRFTRSVTLDGEQIFIGSSLLGDAFTLTVGEHLGLVERVDLEVVDPNDCCPGDANRDGFVSILDYRAVGINFGDSTPTIGDSNCDRFVNLTDIVTTRNLLGSSCAPPEAKSSARIVQVALAGHLKGPDSVRPMAIRLTGGGSLQAGNSMAAKLSLDAPETFSVVTAMVHYDPTALRFVSGKTDRGRFTDDSTTADPRLVAPGVLAISAGNRTGMRGTDLALATLEFEALVPGATEIRVEASGPFTAAALDKAYVPVGVAVLSPLRLSITPAASITDWQSLEGFDRP